MNCTKGDLARVVSPGFVHHCRCGAPGVIVKPDVFVRCVEQEGDSWVLEEPISVSVQFSCRVGFAFGCVKILPDAILRPLRNPGEDEVDEVLRTVGAPAGLVGIPADEVAS